MNQGATRQGVHPLCEFFPSAKRDVDSVVEEASVANAADHIYVASPGNVLVAVSSAFFSTNACTSTRRTRTALPR